LAPLIRATAVQLPWVDLDPRAEMGPSVLAEIVLKWLQKGLNQTLACRAELELNG